METSLIDSVTILDEVVESLSCSLVETLENCYLGLIRISCYLDQL